MRGVDNKLGEVLTTDNGLQTGLYQFAQRAGEGVHEPRGHGPTRVLPEPAGLFEGLGKGRSLGVSLERVFEPLLDLGDQRRVVLVAANRL